MLIYPANLEIARFEETPQVERYEFRSKTIRSFRAFLQAATAKKENGIVYTQFALYDKHGETAAWNVVGP